MTRLQFAALCIIIVVSVFGAALWQTMALEANAAIYRTAAACRQDRNYRALMGERGLDHLCDNAGR